MEHDSSFNKQLKKEITTRAPMNGKFKKLVADIDKNFENVDEITLELKRIKKAISRRRQKRQRHRELSLRLNELNNSKTEIKNEIDALKQKF